MNNDISIIHINCIWDDEADVWIATSPEVRGLVLEDGSLDRLMYRAQEAVPELIALNNQTVCSEYMIRAEKRQFAMV